MPSPTPTIIEHFESGRAVSGNESNRELRYVVTGTENEATVVSLAATTAPASLGGFNGTTVLRRKTITATPLGGGVWDVVVPYEGLDNDNESQFTFDTAGGSVHITQSLGTVGTYHHGDTCSGSGGSGADEDCPDFQGAIGVNGDSISGCDITVPVYNFAETHRIPAANVDGAYKAALFWLTGSVNDAPFKGFEAGEVLFLGASGSARGLEEWEITFKFAASPNVTCLPVGDFVVASKLGWEYLWIRYEDKEDDVAKALVKRPKCAYVEKVYEYKDFSGLGIGT